jgi:tetratricopeptide (TPR) repeat protein
MRIPLLSLSLLLLLIVGLPFFSTGQETPHPTAQQANINVWQDMTDRGNDSMSIADYVTAERLFRESLAFAEQHNLGTADIAESNADLGWSLREQRKYNEAETAYRNALQLYRAIYAENNESILGSKVGLGIALTGLGRYQEGETPLLESLNAYNEKPKVTVCALSFALDALTMLYKSSHQYSKGEGIYTEVFALMTGKRGTPCENFLLLADHLAQLYEDDYRWDLVENLHRDRADLALSMKGPNSELYGDALVSVAKTLEKRGHAEEAAAKYGQAADVYRHANPPALSKVAINLERQELSLYVAGKVDQAKRVHQAMLIASKKSDTDDLQGQMMAVRSRGVEAMNTGKFQEAEQFFAQEKALSLGLSGQDQMLALSDSAFLHENATHQLPEAEAELKQALVIAIATTSPSSTATAAAHFELGMFYRGNHRPADAEESLSSALALYGAGDTEALNRTFQMLGWTYVEDGKYAQAEAIFQRAIKLDEDTHNDAQLALMLTGLGDNYRRANRLTDAETVLIRGMNLAEHLDKPMNREWFGAAMTMASVCEQSGRLPLAEQLYRRVISFVEQDSGPDSVALRFPLDKVAAIMKSQGRLAEANLYEARRDKLPEVPSMR